MQSKSITGAAAALLALALGAGPALATSARTFVSGHGNDSGACSVTAPCRSFAYAIGQTSPSGEISVLDTAGYGAVTITKAVSIVNPGGVEAGISVASGGTAVTVNAGSNDKVALRGLTLEGNGVGQHGIVFAGGASLEIADTVVRDFTSDGISITYTASTNTFYLLISNTTSNDNGGSGILLQPTHNNLYSRLDHVIASHNSINGLFHNSPYGQTIVSNSTFDTNSSEDVEIDQIGFILDHVSARGVNISTYGNAGFSESTIVYLNDSGSCYSTGNNAIFNTFGNACNKGSPSIRQATRP